MKFLFLKNTTSFGWTPFSSISFYIKYCFMYITAHNLSNLVTVTQRPIGFFSKIVYGIRYGSVKLIRGIASLLVLHFHWLTPSGYLFLNGRRLRYLCLCSKRIFVSLKCKIKKFFFLNFSFFPECPTYCKLEKSIYNVRYRIFTKFLFQKIKWFRVFQKWYFFW